MLCHQYLGFVYYLLLLGLLPCFGLSASFCNLSDPSSPATGTIPHLDGNAVTIGDGTYPRATILADGTILGVYTAYSGGSNIITVVQSMDCGATWQPKGTVTTGIGDIDNPFLLQLQSGRILCAFRNHSKDPDTGVYTYFRITVCFSDDGGTTWAYLSTPSQGPAPVNGMWEPFMRLSSVNPANVQLFYSYENAVNDQDSLMRTSYDGGATWTDPSTISGVGITARDGMLGVTSLPLESSNLIAVFESLDTSPGGTGLFSIVAVTSSDDGNTWGNRHVVYSAAGNGNNAAAPQIITVGGTLVVSFQTDEDTGADGGWNSLHTKVVTSLDGWNWGAKTTAFPPETLWAGMVTLDANRFLVMGDNDGAKAQQMDL